MTNNTLAEALKPLEEFDKFLEDFMLSIGLSLDDVLIPNFVEGLKAAHSHIIAHIEMNAEENAFRDEQGVDAPDDEYSDLLNALEGAKQEAEYAAKWAEASLYEQSKKAISRLSQPKPSGWLRIDDPIVETWKAREIEVDLWCRYDDESGSRRKTSLIYGKHDWDDDDYFLSEYGLYATHARLPPQPPEED